MIDKFAEIKKILKLRNACSGILRVKVAGLLEKQAVMTRREYELLNENAKNLQRQVEEHEYNRNRERREVMVAKQVKALQQQLEALKNADTPDARAIAAKERELIAAVHSVGGIRTMDDFNRVLGELNNLYDDYTKTHKAADEAGIKADKAWNALFRGRGGSGSGRAPGSGSRIRIKVGDEEMDWDDGPLPPGATVVGSDSSSIDPKVLEVASSGRAQLVRLPDGGVYLYDRGINGALRLTEEEATRIGAYIATEGFKNRVAEGEFPLPGKGKRVKYSDGSIEDFDKDGKLVKRSWDTPPWAGGGTSSSAASDPAGPVDETTRASFDEYLKAQGWKQDAAGKWSKTGRASGGSPAPVTPLSEQAYRENLLRYNGVSDPSSFNLRLNYDPDTLVDPTRFDTLKREYNRDIANERSARETAFTTTDSSAARREAMSDKENWRNGHFTGIDGIRDASGKYNYFNRHLDPNADRWTTYGALGGGAAGLALTNIGRHNNISVSRGLHALKDYWMGTNTEYDQNHIANTAIDYTVGGLLGAFLGHRLGAAGRRHLSREGRINKKIQQHNRWAERKNNELNKKKYQKTYTINDDLSKTYLINPDGSEDED